MKSSAHGGSRRGAGRKPALSGAADANLNIRIPLSELEAARAAAEAGNVSLTDWVREAMRRAL